MENRNRLPQNVCGQRLFRRTTWQLLLARSAEQKARDATATAVAAAPEVSTLRLIASIIGSLLDHCQSQRIRLERSGAHRRCSGMTHGARPILAQVRSRVPAGFL